MILASIMSMLLEARGFTFLPEGAIAEREHLYSGFSCGYNSPKEVSINDYFGDTREAGF